MVTPVTNVSTRNSGSISAAPPPFIPFQTRPSLECIPDDIVHEILSYLPALQTYHVEFGGFERPPAIPAHFLVCTPTLRALSHTSRLLRSRFLAMAWRSIELCSVNLPEQAASFYSVIGKVTMAYVHVLKACPYLLPLIQTVTVCFTRYRSTEIIPAFAECLVTMPNLVPFRVRLSFLGDVHILEAFRVVIYAHPRMTTDIKDGFEGKRYPSIRKMSLPSSAHGIITCCPNLEEVVSMNGDASPLIGSLVKGGCDQVRIVRGIGAPLRLARLTKFLPRLQHIGLYRSKIPCDMDQLAGFPFLNTIEIDSYPNQSVDTKVEDASKILRENRSKAEKRVIVTRWHDKFTEKPYVIREVIKV